MTESLPISLVCLDLAGIVIDDSVVERAYAEAIATQGIVPGTQDYARSMVRFDRSRGRPPAAVLREQFETDELRAQVAFARVRPVLPGGGAAVRRFRSGCGRRRDRQGGRLGRARRAGHRAVPVRLRWPARIAARSGSGALRRRRAAELPLAGSGAHRDAAARHLRRA